MVDKPKSSEISEEIVGLECFKSIHISLSSYF